MTTGHTWQLFEVASDFEVRRTHIYKPSTLAKLSQEKKVMFGNPIGEASDRKIWNDFEMIQLALGMLKQGMCCPDEGEQQLEEVYAYLKDLQYMDKISEDEKEIYRKRDRYAKFLPRFLRKLVVGVDPQEKNIYNNLH